MSSLIHACTRHRSFLLPALLCLCLNPALAGQTLEPATQLTTASKEQSVGGLDVSNAWVRAMPPGAGVAAAYLTLRNTGKQELQIVGQSSPLARRVEIHEMKILDGQMQMRPLREGLRIPAGQTTELKPGGLHLMLIDIRQDFAPGLVVPIQLMLADGRTIPLQVPVRSAPLGSHAGMQHPGSSHH